jgi:hypothetical protein
VDGFSIIIHLKKYLFTHVPQQTILVCVCVCVCVLGWKPSILCMLGKHSTTELHSQSPPFFIYITALTLLLDVFCLSLSSLIGTFFFESRDHP